MQNETVAGFRLSPQQRRLWQARPEGSDHRAQSVLFLEGNLDRQALKDALEKVVARHEILHTLFHRPSGIKIPLQVIDDRAVPEWRSLDLGACDQQERDLRVAEILQAEGRRPFDFANGPLLRASLLALAPTKHLLLLNLPALCADSTTLQNLTKEIRASYAGEALSDQPLQYADFSEWGNQLLEADDADAKAGKKFWRQAELDTASPLILPFQKKPESETTFELDLVAIDLAPEILDKLEALARQHDASAEVFLLACWQVVLGRLTGQGEVAVANVFNGRKQEELQAAMGLFAQAIPIRGQLTGLSFADFLGQVRDSEAEARQWQEYYESAATPLVQFEYGSGPTKETAGEAVFWERQRRCHLDPFHLKLAILRRGDSAEAAFYYDSQRFRREDIQRTAGYFERILDSVIRGPETSVDSLEILSAEERHPLLVTFNQTTAAYPHNKCVHQLFEEQVERSRDRPALVFEDRLFSYGQLNARANQLAHHLRQQGVNRNVPVGLFMERSAEMLVGLLGILKAGGAYVPLHSELPKARLAFQIAETKAPLVITQEKLLDRLPEFQGAVFCLDRDLTQLASLPPTNPEPVNDSNDLVYVIYTSGSTGVPKGVAVCHRNLANYAHYIQTKLSLEKPENSGGLHFATVSTLSADLGNTCIFPSLISGGCLHVISYETSMDGNRFSRYVAEHPIDVLKITPSHLSALLNVPGGEAALPRKYLILGGEASTWELIQRVKTAGQCAIINHYGPTETTVGSLTYSVGPSDHSPFDTPAVPIGRPIANTEVYILNSKAQLVPLGVPGELCIGGAGVAQGYLNQPQQTAERFVKHPFSNDSNARLYRTGDRARYLADGSVEYLGRLDQQVKIRGFRVELAEIESVLRRYPGIREVAVVAGDDKAGEKRLAAYIVSTSGRTAKIEELRNFLLEQLPDYMVPSAFVTMDSLPLTPNGKLDRLALLNGDQAKLDSDKAFVSPRDPVEEKLAAIWKEVLGVERVGVHDDFFELGGHSLLATQVISRVRSAFGIEVPLRSLFEAPTVAGLAQAVAECQVEIPADPEMDRMLAELEGLSEEEIQKLLALEMQSENS